MAESANVELEKIRHSMAHVMAWAVKELFPDVRFAIGPVIADGFYYDFDLPDKFSPADLERIEERMRELIAQRTEIKKSLMSVEEALRLFDGQPYKLELIDELSRNGATEVSVYEVGAFVDLCRGPHVDSLQELDSRSFKLTGVAGAYWRGDSSRQMLQRIYGTAWKTPKDLEEHLRQLEEASKRDHRLLGQRLDLFSTNLKLGRGLILWHPKGAMVRFLIERFSQGAHVLNGYQWVYSPHIGRAELWETSGHLSFYKDAMYNPLTIDEEEYYLKPMSCPFHVLVYQNTLKSYRDMPIRYAEFATVYRYELSGALHGLTRVRGFTQDDAHVICTPDQVEYEVARALKFSLYILESFGLKDFRAYVATKPYKNYIGEDRDWQFATESLKRAVEEVGLEYDMDEGGGAFYGPKIDLKLYDSLQREWQCSTIQFDFNLPARYEMTYIGSDGKKHVPMMVHRALFGSVERFVAMLIEHYAGDFPFWMAPIQIGIVPITDANVEYAEAVNKRLKKAGFRTQLDATSEQMNAKIRDMELAKIPYIFVVGNREVESNTISVRARVKKGASGVMELDTFLDRIQPELQKGQPQVIFEDW